jgi:hypothetical protein
MFLQSASCKDFSAVSFKACQTKSICAGTMKASVPDTYRKIEKIRYLQLSVTMQFEHLYWSVSVKQIVLQLY